MLMPQRRPAVAGRRSSTDVALIDWRRRPFRTLEQTLDWLLDFFRSPWDTPDLGLTLRNLPRFKNIHLALEKRGFVVEGDTIHECGCAVSARRREIAAPLRKAA